MHPHPAYAAYTHGLANKWTYLARVNGTCQEHYSKLEKAVRTKLLSAICGRHVGDGERDLLSLPTRLGGLGITNPMVDAPQAHKEAMMITRPLVDILLGSPATPSTAFAAQLEVITATRKAHNKHVHDRAVSLRESLPDGSTTALSMRWAQEHGASTWLTALPLTAHGFNLTRREFLDALCLRYGWTPANLPSLCSCGRNFTVEHALSCMRGGYISLRHNEVRDLLAELLSETCHNVATEPELQPLTVASQSSATNTSDCARLDIQASGFWGGSRFETAFLMFRFLIPMQHLTVLPLHPASSNRMTNRRDGSTNTVFKKLKEVVSHHWYFQQMELQVVLQRCFSRDLHPFWPTSVTQHTLRRWAGCDAACHSLFYELV